jgi:cobaltochelatase CobT
LGGEQFTRDYWPVMKDMRAALGPLVNEIEYCRNTADTYALARKMADALRAYDPSLMPPPAPGGEGEASGAGQAGSGQTGNPRAQDASQPSENSPAGHPEGGRTKQQEQDAAGQQAADGASLPAEGQQAGQSESGETGQQAGNSEAGQQAGDSEADQKMAGAAGNGPPSAEPAAGGELSALDAAPKFDDLLAGGDPQQGADAAGDGGTAGAEGADGGAKGRQDDAAGEAQGKGELGEAHKNSTHGGFYREVDKLMRNSFDEKMLQLIEKQAVAANHGSDYRVFSTENDRVEPLPVPPNEDISALISQLESKVAHLCGPMQKNLERLIVARSLATWQPAQRSGRLHSASLARLACNDARVFRKKIEGKSRDVAVELVIDCSGSMGGARINLATQAAYALSTVLTRLNIAHEVIGFTTCGSGMRSERAYAKELRKHAWQYARVEALYMPVIKGYNERMTADVRSRFGWLPHSGILNNNVDGECVDIAARRLAQRPEKTKMMLVLSDGVPAAYGDCDALRVHLKKVVKQIEASGIKVVGLGIQTDAVASFYTRHLVVRRLSDLPTTVLKELKALVVDN